MHLLNLRRMTIKTKIFLLASFSTLIPLIAIGNYTFYYQNEIIENKVATATENYLRLVDSNVTSFVTDIENISNTIFFSNEIQGYLNHNESSPQLYQLENQSRSLLNNITVVNKPYIDGIYIGNENHEFLKVNLGNQLHQDNYDKIEEASWYNKLKESEWGGTWFNANELKLVESNHTRENPLMFGRVIRDLGTSEELGLTIISVNNTVFDNILRDIDIEGAIIIYDGTHPIYANNREQIKSDMLIELETASRYRKALTKEIAGEKYFVNSYTNPETEWKIVSMIPYNGFIKEFYQVRTTTIILFIISFIIALVFAFLISNKITQNLYLLRKVAKRMGRGKVIIPLGFDTKDEIGEIGSRLVEMYNKNNQLNESLYKSKIKEKEAELRALQNHINPHFLYNTLNSIYLMAQKEKVPLISKMAISLSKLFKLTLNDGSSITSVKKEIEQIENYLLIQNIRFDNKINFEIDVDPAILNSNMLKLLLQPIVENAVLHGLEPKEGKGSISIIGKKLKYGMIFKIIDDGIGFDKCEEFGYGINNIQERIQLFYGNTYGISIQSKPNEGTKVTLTIGETDGA